MTTKCQGHSHQMIPIHSTMILPSSSAGELACSSTLCTLNPAHHAAGYQCTSLTTLKRAQYFTSCAIACVYFVSAVCYSTSVGVNASAVITRPILHHLNRRDIYSVDSAGNQQLSTIGFAPVGTMCNNHWSCGLVQDQGTASAFTMAHEAGHV